MKKKRKGKGTGLILALLLALLLVLLLGLLVLRVLKDSAAPIPSAQPTEVIPSEQLFAEPEPVQQTAAPEEEEDELPIAIQTPEEALAAAQQTLSESQGSAESAPAAPAAPAESSGSVGVNETVEVPFVLYD